MSADTQVSSGQPLDEEVAVSRAELSIERDKVEIERERLALERERLAAERERWKTDAALQSRAEGRGIAVSTLVFVSVICALVGGIAGALVGTPRRAAQSVASMGLQALASRAATNATGKGEAPIVLRAVDAGSGRGAYLLILD